MNLGMALSRAASHFRNRCAVICADKKRTFAQIDENSNRLAKGLFNIGIRKQDRVAIFCHNCVEYIEIDWALYKTGMIRVAINPRLSSREVACIIRDSGAKTVIVSPRLTNLISSIQAELPEVKNYICISEFIEGMIEYHEFIEAQNPSLPKLIINEDDIAMLFYTGGTTGTPKGAIHTHESVMNVIMNLQAEHYQLTQSDVFLGGGSLAWADGFRAMICFLEGAQFIIPEQFMPREVLETIEKEKVTLLSTVPTTLIRLYSSPYINEFNLKSLRLIIYGGSPMPTEKLKEALKIFGHKLAQNYGQAEAVMAITHLSIEDHVEGIKEVAKLSSAGRPFTTIEVKVVNERGEDVKPGNIGDVIVKGKITMKGYWQNLEATAEAIKDGWLYTGDIGYFDADGYLYLLDRKKDMIISGGLNIYAREIEEVVQTHPAVAEVAVIGVPDEEWGESVKAIVVLKSGMSSSAEDIIQFCSKILARYKKPKSVGFVSELPKTSLGKISKKDLRAPFWAGQERAIH